MLREDLERHGREWSAPGFQALAVYRVGHHARLRVSATAWYHKKRPTFSDTLAAVRRQVWCDQGLFASRHSPEPAKLQSALRDGIVHALCHAA